MGKYIRSLTVYFDTELQQKDIPLFRGAVLNCLGEKASFLYHNHIGDHSFRYSYPLIQYKRINGKAAIVCVEEGVDLIGQFLMQDYNPLIINGVEKVFNTQRIQPARILVQTWEKSFSYHLSQWLPLNSKNYHVYQSLDGIVEKVSLLENILKGNLLSMLKGWGIHQEQPILVKIVEHSTPYLLYYKGIKLMAFNVDFSCNLSIPNNIGIGKNASIGFGVVHQKHNTIKEQ